MFSNIIPFLLPIEESLDENKNARDALFASNQIYGNASTSLPFTSSPGVKWHTLHVEDTDSGYYGALYIELDNNGYPTGQYIMANRGTEISFNGLSDITTDIDMARGNLPLQFKDAFNFYEKCITIIKENGHDAKDLIITGHSLGGSIAQAIGVKYGNETVTFNAYGIKHLNSEILNGEEEKDFYDNITNLRLNMDPISAWSDHNGVVRTYLSSLSPVSHGLILFFENIVFFSTPVPDSINPLLLNEYKLYLFSYGEIIKHILELFFSATSTASPLVFDLDNNGHAATTQIFFDHDANGFAEFTNWIADGDVLLVRDLNGNGQIDSGKELFGNQTLLPSGEKAANGFLALAALDENKDGLFNAADAVFSELRLWRDANGNGRVENEELLMLKDYIQSVSLDYETTSEIDAAGNTYRQKGTFTTLSGEIQSVIDIWFKTDPVQAINRNPIIVPDDVQTLPQIFLAGNFPSLHQAMARNPVLKNMVSAFAGLDDVILQHNACSALIYEWCGATNINPTSRGPNIDARQMHAVEQFTGQFFKLDENFRPQRNAGEFLTSAFNTINDFVYAQLTFANQYANIIHALQPAFPETGIPTQGTDIEWNVQAAAMILKEQAAGKTNPEMYLRDFGQTLKDSHLYVTEDIQKSILKYAQMSDPSLLPYINTYNVIEGTDENNTLKGTIGNDWIKARDGRDTINADDGDDIIEAGTGHDFITPGKGTNIVRFNPGDGEDTIRVSLSTQTPLNTQNWIEFGEDITPDMVLMNTESGLVFTFIGNSTDSLTLEFSRREPLSNPLAGVVFASGHTWTLPEIMTRLYAGTEFDDHIEGSTKDDTITGLMGKDTIYGYNGNDDLSGNDGNDLVKGQNGNDIIYGDNGNDGLHGENGDDILFGGEGNDQLDGGAGNDILNGGIGNDKYDFGEGTDSMLYNSGDGQDYIFASKLNSIKNTLCFQKDITPEDIVGAQTSSNQFNILFKNTPEDSIALNYFIQKTTLDHDMRPIDFIEFEDGTIWTPHDLLLRHYQGTINADKMYGTMDDNTMYGREGADFIWSEAGNDTLYGHEDKDTLKGFAGNDFIDGGSDDDKLDGDEGNDILIGGTGNDTLWGGEGINIYRFGLGDGQDIIMPSTVIAGITNFSTLEFMEGIEEEMVSFSKSNSNLTINIRNGEDRIKIDNFFSFASSNDARLGFNEILFASGTHWSVADILAKFSDSIQTFTGQRNETYITGIDAGLIDTIENWFSSSY